MWYVLIMVAFKHPHFTGNSSVPHLVLLPYRVGLEWGKTTRYSANCDSATEWVTLVNLEMLTHLQYNWLRLKPYWSNWHACATRGSWFKRMWPLISLHFIWTINTQNLIITKQNFPPLFSDLLMIYKQAFSLAAGSKLLWASWELTHIANTFLMI